MGVFQAPPYVLNVLLDDLAHKATKRCLPETELCVKLDAWIGGTLLNFAVVMRGCAAATNAAILQAGWIGLGKVIVPASLISARLNHRLHVPSTYPRHEYGRLKQLVQVPWGGDPIPVYVSAILRAWYVLDYFEYDVIGDVVDDWEPLTTDGGRVYFAYVQVLPDHQMEASAGTLLVP